MILEEKSKIFIFSLQHKTLISLNQGQGSIFKLRECAQLILRLEKPKNRRFSHKSPKMFDFRFNTPIPSLNLGQGSVFKVRECVIDSPHEINPRNMILREKFQNFSIFASIHTSISLNHCQGSVFKVRECAQSIFRMI